MKIWHISDTHTDHRYLHVPEVDMVVHSGDATNSKESHTNGIELTNFLEWFSNLPIKHKIFVSGNHDVVTQRLRYWPKQISERGITYLENNGTEIDGLKIWGSPYSPSFGEGWAWNIPRNKSSLLWSQIPVYTDILITHGPPAGILDLSFRKNRLLENCGDTSLASAVMVKNVKVHLFGHIHNSGKIVNSGVFKRCLHDGRIITYSNGSVVSDGNKDCLVSNGNIIDINS